LPEKRVPCNAELCSAALPQLEPNKVQRYEPVAKSGAFT